MLFTKKHSLKKVKKILITGGSGFIGKNLKESLGKEFKIFAPSSKQLNLLDYSQVQNYLKKHKFDDVIHSAAYMVTRNSSKDPTLELGYNLRMYFNLARANNLYKRMFYFGSGAEYDMRHYRPKMSEEYFDTHVPMDDYGFAKYIMAKFTQHLDNVYDLKLFGIFGKYEDWQIRFISNACCKAVFSMDITIKQNVYFDYLYIGDLAKIMKKFLKFKKIPYKHYNICTGETVDLLSIAKIVKEISGKKISIVVKKRGLKKEYSGDNKRLLKLLENFRFTPLKESIGELYNWYEDNKKIIDKSKLLFDK